MRENVAAHEPACSSCRRFLQLETGKDGFPPIRQSYDELFEHGNGMLVCGGDDADPGTKTMPNIAYQFNAITNLQA
jgi:hypothetical protein